jgi:hypothetical protein
MLQKIMASAWLKSPKIGLPSTRTVLATITNDPRATVPPKMALPPGSVTLCKPAAAAAATETVRPRYEIGGKDGSFQEAIKLMVEAFNKGKKFSKDTTDFLKVMCNGDFEHPTFLEASSKVTCYENRRPKDFALKGVETQANVALGDVKGTRKTKISPTKAAEVMMCFPHTGRDVAPWAAMAGAIERQEEGAVERLVEAVSAIAGKAYKMPTTKDEVTSFVRIAKQVFQDESIRSNQELIITLLGEAKGKLTEDGRLLVTLREPYERDWEFDALLKDQGWKIERAIKVPLSDLAEYGYVTLRTKGDDRPVREGKEQGSAWLYICSCDRGVAVRKDLSDMFEKAKAVKADAFGKENVPQMQLTRI